MGFRPRLLLWRGGICSLLNDGGEGGGGLLGDDPGEMMVLGAAGRLGAGVVDVAPGEWVGWAGNAAGVRVAEAYDRRGLPGWFLGVLRAGVVGGGEASTGIGGGSCGSVGAAVVEGGSSWGCLASDGMGVGGLSGALGASGSGKDGMVWRGVYRRRKQLFRVVRQPDPSVLMEYWWYCRTSTTVPVLSHLVGWLVLDQDCVTAFERGEALCVLVPSGAACDGLLGQCSLA